MDSNVRSRLSAQLLNTTWQQTELQCESDLAKLQEWSQQFEIYAAKQVWDIQNTPFSSSNLQNALSTPWEAAMDYKHINDRYHRGRTAVDEFIGKKHQFMRVSSQVLAHAAIVQQQGQNGNQGFLSWLIHVGFWKQTSVQPIITWPYMFYLTLTTSWCWAIRLTILVGDFTLWPTRPWDDIQWFQMVSTVPSNISFPLGIYWFNSLSSSPFAPCTCSGALAIDESVTLAQGVASGNANTLAFWLLPQWHSSAAKQATLRHRRLLEDKVIGCHDLELKYVSFISHPISWMCIPWK